MNNNTLHFASSDQVNIHSFMALNPQLLPNGMPVPFVNEMFVLVRDGVEFEVDKIPGFVFPFLLLSVLSILGFHFNFSLIQRAWRSCEGQGSDLLV